MGTGSVSVGHSHAEKITLLQMEWRAETHSNRIIFYSFISTILGEILVASVQEGICYMGLAKDKELAFNDLSKRYPNVIFQENELSLHRAVQNFFCNEWAITEPIPLCVKATAFQIAVWRDVLTIPIGKVTTYGDIARRVGRPSAARAVGNAVAKNPIMYLIPCHRVVCSTNKIGNFYWGVAAKLQFLNYESLPFDKIDKFYNWETILF